MGREIRSVVWWSLAVDCIDYAWEGRCSMSASMVKIIHFIFDPRTRVHKSIAYHTARVLS